MTQISRTRRLFLSVSTALLVATSAPAAMAFCFSNDSLSNTSLTVRQMPEDAFKKTVVRTVEHSNCNILPAKQKAKCLDLKNKKKAWEDQAAADVYEFLTDLPLVGDPVDKAATYAKEKVFAYAKWQDQAIKDAEKFLDDALKPFSTRFRQTVGPDGTQCCSWKNRDCNPSGKKDGKIYFNMKYAGISRVVKLGATDHMECTIDEGNPRGAVCRNYVWPESPFRAHKQTSRGMLIKSKHTGKCLEVGGWKKNNGANVNMWKCHGGKNQRWVVYKNGTIRSEMNWKCLDVASGPDKASKNGANVHMWDCHGGQNQRWTYGRDGKIVSRAPGQNNWCLEVGGWKKDDGANANIWKCGGKQANQSWAAVKK